MKEEILSFDVKGNVLGIIVLIMSLFAIVLSFFSIFNLVAFILSIMLIVLSSMAILNSEQKNLPTIALLLSVLALLTVMIMNTLVFDHTAIDGENIPDELEQNIDSKDEDNIDDILDSQDNENSILGIENNIVRHAVPLNDNIDLSTLKTDEAYADIIKVEITAKPEGKTEDGEMVTRIDYVLTNISSEDVENIQFAIIGENSDGQKFATSFNKIDSLKPNETFENGHSQKGSFILDDIKSIVNEVK